MSDSKERNAEAELTDADRALIERARRKAFLLYEGKVVAHRSCGICLAETFGVPWRPYQALRKGGLTGEGACGAIRAGEMILGELLGPERPDEAAPERLKRAILFYQAAWRERQARAGWHDTICNTLVAPFSEFAGPERAGFCANMAAETAALVAEALIRERESFEIREIPEIPGVPEL